MGTHFSDVSTGVTTPPAFHSIQTAFCRARALHPTGSKQYVTDPTLLVACFNHVVRLSDADSLFEGVLNETIRSNLHVRIENGQSWAYFYIGPITDFSQNPSLKDKLDSVLIGAIAMYLLAVKDLNNSFDTANHQLTSTFMKKYPNLEVPSVKLLIEQIETMD